MDVKEDHQQQTTMKKKEKYNQYHHIHKVQHFKKKKKKQKRCYGSHKQSRTISDNNQLPLGDLVQIPDFQQLSISSQQSSSTEEEEKKKKYNQKTTVSNHLDIASNTDPTLLLPDYCMMDDIKLKEMLLMTSTLEQDFNTVAFGNLLDNEDIFVCIRQLAQRINRFNYTKLQYEQWTYYYDLGMKESIWHGRVPKKMADANSMCYTYGRSRMLIQQRQQKYKRQLEQIQNETNTHMERAKAIVSSNSLDLVKLMNIINQLIDKDQYQLRVELQRRRILLQFDAKEHQLVNEFYQMKPRPSEVHSARIIWKAIHGQQTLQYEVAIFKKWLSTQSLQSSCGLRDLQLSKMNSIFTDLVFQTQQTSIDDLASQTLTKAEEITNTYAQKAFNEKQKLLNVKSSHKNIAHFDKIMEVVLNRGHNMLERAQHDIEQKLLRLTDQSKPPIIEQQFSV